jgi:hypothetical protein
MSTAGVNVDTTTRQAGYIADNSSVTGISLAKCVCIRDVFGAVECEEGKDGDGEEW